MPIDFDDTKELRVQFYTIIINVSKINEVFGRVYDFAKEFDLTGVTNGELLILYLMSLDEFYCDLVSNILEPNEFKDKRDFFLIKEELVFGVGYRPSSRFNQPLSSLEGINWLGSVLKKNGNWVWKINQRLVCHK
jgi:hypothetical protein